MAKNQTLAKPVSAIGEEIGYELGKQMVSDYQTANQNDVHFYSIGRNIIDQILAQPGCEGIKFYNAYNEMGQKTLVYVGLNSDGKAIMEFTCINAEGMLESYKGIVADRIKTGGGGPGNPPPPPPPDGGGMIPGADGWNWTID